MSFADPISLLRHKLLLEDLAKEATSSLPVVLKLFQSHKKVNIVKCKNSPFPEDLSILRFNKLSGFAVRIRFS